MTCIKFQGGVICVGSETIQLGPYYFEMHPYCGPMRLCKDGSVSKRDFPGAFWPLFEKWQAEQEKQHEPQT